MALAYRDTIRSSTNCDFIFILDTPYTLHVQQKNTRTQYAYTVNKAAFE